MGGLRATWAMIALAVATAVGCATRDMDPERKTSSPTARSVREERGRSFVFETPLPIDRPLHKYPPEMEATGQEGWVMACFRVETNGSTSNIEVVDSSGSRPFEKEALKAVRRYRYEPARLDGDRVAYDDVCVHLTFEMESGRGVRRSFRKQYRHIRKLIEQGDLDDAESEMVALRDQGVFTLLEQSALYSAEYSLEMKRGDHLAAVRALELAGLTGGLFEGDERYARHHQALFALYAELGWYAKALDTYAALKLERADVSAIDATARSISKLVNGDGDVAASARINSTRWSAARCWHHEPVRRELAVTELEGKVDEILVLCERRSDSVNYPEGVVWKIPESWGACRLRICGDAGTSFRLVEYGPDQPRNIP